MNREPYETAPIEIREDLAAAHYLYDRAKHDEAGQWVEF